MDEKEKDLQHKRGRIRNNIREMVLGDREEKILKDLKQRLLLSLIFVVPLLVVAWVAEDKQWYLAVQFALLLPILIVNHRVFIDGFAAIHHRNPEKNTLAAIGTVAALLILQFAVAGVFLTTMAVCRHSEAYVKCKLDDHLRQLMKAAPEDQKLEPGQIVPVRKGDLIPADGTITEGDTVIEEELITGDRVPVEKGQGAPVFAGTKILTGDFQMEVLRSGEETTISRIIEHITDAIATKPPMAERTERYARLLVLMVVILAALSAALWIASGSQVTDAIIVAITILIIASPYAFTVAVPMSILAATVRGAKDGILIRSASILEVARDINTIALNKSGTVTGGNPKVSDVIKLSGEFSMRLAGALEQESKHPLGQEILRAAKEEPGVIPQAQTLEHVPGRGVRGSIDGKVYLIGGENFMKGNGISVNLPEVEVLYTQGKSVIFFANESRVIGLIALRDAPKAVSMKAVSRIEGMGIDVVMLTGDNEPTAEAIRREVGIDKAYAQVLPGEKAQIIEELKGTDDTRKKVVAMVGDGRDDAEAIAKADIGFAIGAGLEMDVQPTDVILIENDLTDVVRSINLSRKTIRYIRQDITFAWCYNVLAIAAAASILVPVVGRVITPELAPVLAALCMCVSQILVVVSTMRVKNTLI